MKQLILSIFITILSFSYVHGAIYYVTNGGDAGIGSLRQAILDADTNPGDDIVTVDASVSTITLTTLWASAPYPINLPFLENVVIDGGGVTIQSNVASQCFQLGQNVIVSGIEFKNFQYSALLSINDNSITTFINLCTFDNCSNFIFQGGVSGGGAIQIIGGTHEITDCEFLGCSSTKGGGVNLQYGGGTSTIFNACTFQFNIATSGNGRAINLEDGNDIILEGLTSFGNAPEQDIYIEPAPGDVIGATVTLDSTFDMLGSEQLHIRK